MTMVTSIAMASAPNDQIQMLEGLGYLDGNRLVLTVEDSIYWRGGFAQRMGTVVVGSGWETYPGGRAVLISGLLSDQRRDRVAPARRRERAEAPTLPPVQCGGTTPRYMVDSSLLIWGLSRD